MKRAYICGPLTELPPKLQKKVKALYSCLGDVFEKELGVRAFVPHEHYDPIKHSGFEPSQVDDAERGQIGALTSVLVVVAIEPSWGGGIEVEIANRSGVPVIIFCNGRKLKSRKISRLLRGNPAVKKVLPYGNFTNVPGMLRKFLRAEKVDLMRKTNTKATFAGE